MPPVSCLLGRSNYAAHIARLSSARGPIQCYAGIARAAGMLVSPKRNEYVRFVQQCMERLERWLLDFWVVLGEKLKNYTQRLKGRVQPRIVLDPRNVQQTFEVLHSVSVELNSLLTSVLRQ